MRQLQRLRLINPSVLLAELEIDAICSDHFGLLFTVTPRYEVDTTWSSSVSQNVYLCFAGFCLVEIHKLLHFDGLNFIFH